MACTRRHKVDLVYRALYMVMLAIIERLQSKRVVVNLYHKMQRVIGLRRLVYWVAAHERFVRVIKCFVDSTNDVGRRELIMPAVVTIFSIAGYVLLNGDDGVAPTKVVLVLAKAALTADEETRNRRVKSVAKSFLGSATYMVDKVCALCQERAECPDIAESETYAYDAASRQDLTVEDDELLNDLRGVMDLLVKISVNNDDLVACITLVTALGHDTDNDIGGIPKIEGPEQTEGAEQQKIKKLVTDAIKLLTPREVDLFKAMEAHIVDVETMIRNFMHGERVLAFTKPIASCVTMTNNLQSSLADLRGDVSSLADLKPTVASLGDRLTALYVDVAKERRRADKLLAGMGDDIRAVQEMQAELTQMRKQVATELAEACEHVRKQLTAELANAREQMRKQMQAELATELAKAREQMRKQLTAELATELAKAREHVRKQLTAELAEAREQMHEQMNAMNACTRSELTAVCEQQSRMLVTHTGRLDALDHALTSSAGMHAKAVWELQQDVGALRDILCEESQTLQQSIAMVDIEIQGQLDKQQQRLDELAGHHLSHQFVPMWVPYQMAAQMMSSS